MGLAGIGYLAGGAAQGMQNATKDYALMQQVQLAQAANTRAQTTFDEAQAYQKDLAKAVQGLQSKGNTVVAPSDQASVNQNFAPANAGVNPVQNAVAQPGDMSAGGLMPQSSAPAPATPAPAPAMTPFQKPSLADTSLAPAATPTEPSSTPMPSLDNPLALAGRPGSTIPDNMQYISTVLRVKAEHGMLTANDVSAAQQIQQRGWEQAIQHMQAGDAASALQVIDPSGRLGIDPNQIKVGRTQWQVPGTEQKVPAYTYTYTDPNGVDHVFNSAQMKYDMTPIAGVAQLGQAQQQLDQTGAYQRGMVGAAVTNADANAALVPARKAEIQNMGNFYGNMKGSGPDAAALAKYQTEAKTIYEDPTLTDAQKTVKLKNLGMSYGIRGSMTGGQKGTAALDAYTKLLPQYTQMYPHNPAKAIAMAKQDAGLTGSVASAPPTAQYGGAGGSGLAQPVNAPPSYPAYSGPNANIYNQLAMPQRQRTQLLLGPPADVSPNDWAQSQPAQLGAIDAQIRGLSGMIQRGQQ